MIVHGPYPIGEPRVARQASAAADGGFSVDVIAMRRPGEPTKEMVDSIRVFRLPIRHRRGAGPMLFAAEYLGFAFLSTLLAGRLSARHSYDIVQIHSPPDFLIIASAIPRLRGALVVLDVHDLSSDMFAMRFGSGRASGSAQRILRLVEASSIRAADQVITVHNAYRDELIRRGAPSEKVTIVMNSLDEELLKDVASSPKGTNRRVVYAGSLTPHYGVRLLVVAAALVRDAFPDLVVDIYGEGDALPDLRREIDQLGLEGTVNLKGQVAHAELLSQIRGATVGVVPNLPIALNRFALSSKLMEYVALGIPSVVADLPTLRSHFSDQEVMFFGAGDANSLATALIDTIGDSKSAQDRARAASQRYAKYAWPEQARRYVTLLGTRMRTG